MVTATVEQYKDQDIHVDLTDIRHVFCLRVFTLHASCKSALRHEITHLICAW